MIEARALTKRYEDTVAVDGLSFDVTPGRVTGFLGPNGAGKSTTMRLILGLDAPSGGTVTVNGAPYGAHRFPMHEVGVLLDAQATGSLANASTRSSSWSGSTTWRAAASAPSRSA
jgi:ABC-2 type transport system ATP-binding protein